MPCNTAFYPMKPVNKPTEGHKKLRDALVASGKRQQEFAAMLGISMQSLNHLIRVRRKPSERVKQVIAKKCGIGVELWA